jgi:hypothetical protein
MTRQQAIVHNVATENLADILERVLDKGIVIAGDVKVQIGDVELLTIRIRLLICSVDKAHELGIDWWRRDSFYGSRMAQEREAELEALRKRVAELECERGR